jgi:hypothetical protein
LSENGDGRRRKLFSADYLRAFGGRVVLAQTDWTAKRFAWGGQLLSISASGMVSRQFRQVINKPVQTGLEHQRTVVIAPSDRHKHFAPNRLAQYDHHHAGLIELSHRYL